MGLRQELRDLIINHENELGVSEELGGLVRMQEEARISMHFFQRVKTIVVDKTLEPEVPVNETVMFLNKLRTLIDNTDVEVIQQARSNTYKRLMKAFEKKEYAAVWHRLGFTLDFIIYLKATMKDKKTGTNWELTTDA